MSHVCLRLVVPNQPSPARDRAANVKQDLESVKANIAYDDALFGPAKFICGNS